MTSTTNLRALDAIDLFAGPGGWDLAAQSLGIEVLGIEWDQAACDTRRAAGLRTVQGDVRDFGPGTDFFGAYVLGVPGFIASPPCQTFSMAGNGDGRKHLDTLRATIQWMTSRGVTDLALIKQYLENHGMDDRSTLVLEPLRWIIEADTADRPFAWIALEQVATVQPLWDAYADALATLGYSVSTGILNAEQYGVPQTRRRAVLVAKHWTNQADGGAVLPQPTHSRFYSRDRARLDQGVLPWVSMADALSWGTTDRPAPTVCAGGARTGGAEPFGNGARQTLLAAEGGPTWKQRSNYSGPPSATKRTAAERGRGTRELTEPSFAITSKQFDFIRDVTPSARVRPTVAEVAILQTFPADHPWQGTKGKQHEQVGNAVPPLLAQAVLQAVIPARTTPDLPSLV
jgi:DNA (cytosine-5)-methyltransferase 1